jgi:hypothetical protein
VLQAPLPFIAQRDAFFNRVVNRSGQAWNKPGDCKTFHAIAAGGGQ